MNSAASQSGQQTIHDDESSVGGGGDDQFPNGMWVLVVDDDIVCLNVVETMLRHCKYKVTYCTRAEVALFYLRKYNNLFDVVITDVHMPDMDGFKLLQHIGLEMDLPVIMMSADDSNSVIMKGITHGACDYLIKPVNIDTLRTIWQHVVRKRECTRSWKDEGESLSLKKPRFHWSVELHQQFLAAVNLLGMDNVSPTRIFKLMNVPWLNIGQISSHLQKYRKYLGNLSELQHPEGMNAGFMGELSSMSPLTELEPPQSMGPPQAAALGWESNSKSSMGGQSQSQIHIQDQGQTQTQTQSQAQSNTNAHNGLDASNPLLLQHDDTFYFEPHGEDDDLHAVIKHDTLYSEPYGQDNDLAAYLNYVSS